MALPYLPSEISPDLPNDFHNVGGFVAIQELARISGWILFIQMDFPFFGLNIRTNNFIESFIVC